MKYDGCRRAIVEMNSTKLRCGAHLVATFGDFLASHEDMAR
jgi:hypothetical protein